MDNKFHRSLVAHGVHVKTGGITGAELLEKACHQKAKYGTEHAAEFMRDHGISYELSLIALVGSNVARREYGVDSADSDKLHNRKPTK